MQKQWQEGDAAYHYIYSDEVGRIIGETGLVGNIRRGVHYCTVYPTPNEHISLGTYISAECAKGMVMSYWKQRDKTVDEKGPRLIL